MDAADIKVAGALYGHPNFDWDSIFDSPYPVLRWLGNSDWDTSYIVADYPDVCWCGNCISEKGSRLRGHCDKCESKELDRTFIQINLLSSALKCHPATAEAVLAWSIYIWKTNRFLTNRLSKLNSRYSWMKEL